MSDTPKRPDSAGDTPLVYLDYYSCMWNTLTVVDPATGKSLRFDNSDLCRCFPKWEDRDGFLKQQLRSKTA